MSIHSDTGPFALIPEWVLDAEISPQAVRLYGVLGRYADCNGKAYPSRQALAERMRVKSTRTVDAALAELEEIKAVEVEHRFHEQGGKTSNSYLLRRVPPDCTSDEQPAAHPMSSPLRMNENQSNEIQNPPGSGAQPLVAAFVDRSRALGSDPPKRVVGQLAREVAGLLAEGVAPERLEQGFAIMLERGLHPSTLASCVHQAGLPPPKRNGRGVDLDALFAEINAELRAEAAL